MPTRAPIVEGTLQGQINALGERMERGFTELKELLQAFDARVRAVEQAEASCHPMTQQRFAALEKTTEQHTHDIKVLNETVAELRHANRLLTWLGGMLGSALVLWLVSQILGLIK